MLVSDRSRQLNRLQRIIDTQTAIVQSNLDLAGFMQMIVDTLQELTAAKGAVIELVDDEWMVYRCASGLIKPHVGLRLRRAGSLSGLCLAMEQPLCCEDAEADARVDREACRCVGVSSMVCTPLFQNGVPIGVLKVMSDRVSAFDEDDVQTLNLLAGMLGAALAKQLAFDTLQEAEMRMRVLLENANDAMISVDEAGRVLRWNAAAERMFSLSAEQALGAGIAALAAGPCPGLAFIFAGTDGGHGQLSACEFPSPVPGGQPMFVEFTVTQNRFGSSAELTAFIHDVTEHKRLEQTIRDAALTDSLTGVANRRKLMDVLTHALERGHRGNSGMALLFMDLNDFKQINDIHGHDVGDSVLQAFAARLKSCTRTADVIGRLGGDEFIVLAEGLSSEAEALRFAAKIIAALAVPFSDLPISLASSIGISVYRQQASAQEWLCEADQAMYIAKRRGNGESEVALFMAKGPQTTPLQ